MEAKFDMDQWIKAKKAAGQWQGGEESDKKYHKAFDASKPGTNYSKPGTNYAKPGTR